MIPLHSSTFVCIRLVTRLNSSTFVCDSSTFVCTRLHSSNDSSVFLEYITVDSICNDIFEIALRWRNHNIGEVFISSVAYSSKVSHELIQQLNHLLYKRCIEYGCNFIYNGAISTTDLWTHGIHLLKSGITKIAKKLISSFNYFLGTVIQNSRSC